MLFCFKVGITFLVIALFIGFPLLVILDLYPHKSRENPVMLFKWKVAALALVFLSAFFFLLSLILAIWS